MIHLWRVQGRPSERASWPGDASPSELSIITLRFRWPERRKASSTSAGIGSTRHGGLRKTWLFSGNHPTGGPGHVTGHVTRGVASRDRSRDPGRLPAASPAPRDMAPAGDPKGVAEKEPGRRRRAGAATAPGKRSAYACFFFITSTATMAITARTPRISSATPRPAKPALVLCTGWAAAMAK